MEIKVIQKDLQGNIINRYDSYTQAAKTLGCDESTIRKAAKNPDRIVFGKFKFSNEEENYVETQDTPKTPKILLLDIETSLILAQVFQKQVWKARISHNQLVSDYYMLTWSAKWLGEDTIYSDRLDSIEVYYENDKRIVESLWKLLDAADIVCGHNSDTFDIPNIFTRCVYHGIIPPSPFRQIDTLKIAQKTFGFTHNSLDALAKFFKIEGKISTTIELWKECIRGNEEALKEMETYNKQDVKVLEEIYYRLRPFAKGLPNINLYRDVDEDVCPTCGSKKIDILTNKYFYTQNVKYSVFRCNSCGAVSRSKKGVENLNIQNVTTIPR